MSIEWLITSVVTALIVCDSYQVRFGLLQAGKFGAPQKRLRFFLIAAKLGLRLPAFPQPLYEFPFISTKIRFPMGIVLELDPVVRGTMPFHRVTIEDAISDLPLYDWYVASMHDVVLDLHRT